MRAMFAPLFSLALCGGLVAAGPVKFMSFWQYEPSDFIGWTNFGFTDSPSDLVAGAATGIHGMLNVEGIFCAVSPVPPHGLILNPNAMAEWCVGWVPACASHTNAIKVGFRVSDCSCAGKRGGRVSSTLQWPTAHCLVSSLVLRMVIWFGPSNKPPNKPLCSAVGSGDELIWNGLDPTNVSFIAQFVRSEFPNTVIYTNEAAPSTQNGNCFFSPSDDRLLFLLCWCLRIRHGPRRACFSIWLVSTCTRSVFTRHSLMNVC